MKKLLIILVLAAAGFLGYAAYTAKQKQVASPGGLPDAAPSRKEWTPEEITKDTQGYLVWSDRQIQTQIAEREKRLALLTTRRAEVVTKQQAIVQKRADVENFHNRLKQALQNAEDEDRWPVRMAGRTFERAKALEYIEQTGAWLNDRQPLTDAYAAAIRKMDDSTAALRKDIGDLGIMRENLALELDRVKLNQGMAELDQLRKTETQLASMSKSLTQMSDAEAPILPTAKSDRIDIDAIVK